MTTLLVVTEVNSRGRKFVVAKDEQNRFWGIESIFIDADGRTTRELNGLSDNLSDTAGQCVERCLQRIETEYLVNNGIDKIVATFMVCAKMSFEEATMMADVYKRHSK